MSIAMNQEHSRAELPNDGARPTADHAAGKPGAVQDAEGGRKRNVVGDGHLVAHDEKNQHGGRDSKRQRIGPCADSAV